MLRRLLKMIQEHVDTRREGLVPRGVTDPRRKKPTYSLDEVWKTAIIMFCAMMQSVRAATQFAKDHGSKLVCGIGRTALSDVLARLDPREAIKVLHQQVHAEHRRKALEPRGLPVGVLAFDGHTNWTGGEKVNEYCQRNHKDDPGETRLQCQYRTLRAALVSSPAPTFLHDHPIPAGTNEMGAFAEAYKEVDEEFGRSNLYEIVTIDAGPCSLENATLIHRSGKAYVFGLKGNQPELYEEAQRILLPMAEEEPPEAVSEWFMERSRLIQCRLWRTREMQGWNGWDHLRQVWLVRKVARGPDGTEEVIEDRFFLSSVPVNRLKPREILEVVRRHWRIENECFWTLDTQWKEDSGFWVRKGNGLMVCSILRMIAYNIVALLRYVHGKSESWRRRTWRSIADLIRDYLVAMALGAEILPPKV
jgi:predicted transposase YbfD/YdcC